MSTKYKVYGFPLEILANQSLTSNYQKNNLARKYFEEHNNLVVNLHTKKKIKHNILNLN